MEIEPACRFRYGTLRKRFFTPLKVKIATDKERIGYARIKGHLFNIGEYPGAVPHNVAYRKGEIIKVFSSEKVFRVLGYYEGYKQGVKYGAEYYLDERKC